MKTFKTTIISAACVASALLLAACSNDDMPNGKTTTQINAAENIEFSLSFSDYNAEDTVNHATRAAMDAELAKPRIVPMGDMMYAEVSLQRDTTKATPKEKAAATRALTDGTYTIYAYQGTTLKGTLTGIVSSNVFTPTSSNQEIGLEPGTYTFVCCNDKVNVSGETWTIDRTNLENARIGIAAGQVITATPRKQKVAFEMKYVGSRLKVQLQADGFPIWDPAGTLTSTANIPSKVEFNTATQTYTMKEDAALAENLTFTNVPHTSFLNQNASAPANWNDYYYFLPSTKGADLKLSLTGGTAYRLPLNGRSVTFPALASMTPNNSYRLVMKLHYNYIYLYSDGKTGQKTDADYSSKTPIAVVVSRSKRIAAALNDIDTRTISNYNWGRSDITTTTTASSTLADHLTDMDGYDYTYSTTYSTDGVAKGNDATNYPGFYAAAHYDPGVPVTGTNIGKWYLPSMGEWNLFFKNLVYLANEDLTETTGYRYESLHPQTYAIRQTWVNVDNWPSGNYYWDYLSSSEDSQQRFYSYCTELKQPNSYAWFPASTLARHFVRRVYKNAVTGVGYDEIVLIRPFVRY